MEELAQGSCPKWRSLARGQERHRVARGVEQAVVVNPGKRVKVWGRESWEVFSGGAVEGKEKDERRSSWRAEVGFGLGFIGGFQGSPAPERRVNLQRLWERPADRHGRKQFREVAARSLVA